MHFVAGHRTIDDNLISDIKLKEKKQQNLCHTKFYYYMITPQNRYYQGWLMVLHGSIYTLR